MLGKEVSSGQKLDIKASEWNIVRRWVDQVRAKGFGKLDAALKEKYIPSCQIRVWNDTDEYPSGTTYPAFGVVGLPNHSIDPADEDVRYQSTHQPVALAALPTATGPFGIVTAPITGQTVGICVVAGVTVAAVEILDITHGYAKPIAGDNTKLQSAVSGPVQLISRYDSTSSLEYALVFVHVNANTTEVTNISNRLYTVNISGTPTAGTFTLQITNPDATTTNTGAISYNSSFDTVKSNITAALNAVLGSSYAELGGETWAAISVRMGDSGHTLTGGSVGSLTGASGITVTDLADGSSGWQVPITYVDNRTGVKVLNDGTLAAFPASYTQSGVVNLTIQNMGDGVKLFSGHVYMGRTYNTGTYKDTSYDGRFYIYSTYNTVAAMNVVVDASDGFPLAVVLNQGTPGNAFENQLRVSEVSTDQSKWEFKSSNRAGTLVYVTLSLEQFVNGGGYLPGSVVEVKSGYNSHYRVVRTAAAPGSPSWPLDNTGATSGIFEGIDTDSTTYGPAFAGGIFYGHNPYGTPIPDLVSGGTTLDDAINAINQILGLLRSSGILTT